MRETTRSGIVSYAKCPRYFYYAFAAGPTGTGLSSDHFSMDLAVGIAVHSGLEHLLKSIGSDVPASVAAALASFDAETKGKLPEGGDTWTQEAQTYYLTESRALVEGLVRGWARAGWPDFIQAYEILSVEEEARTYLAEDVPMRSRWDFIVRDRLTRLLYLGNWKTAADFFDWSFKWEWDVQLWTETIAAEQKLKEPVAGVLMVGLKKGSLRDGMRGSPFLYGYRKRQEGGPTVYSYEYERAKGWEKFPSWKLEGSSSPVEDWINQMPEDLLRKQFYCTSPIAKDEQIISAWLRQVVRAERDINYFLDSSLEEEATKLDFFRQNFTSINCKKCRFQSLCRGRSMDEALRDGTFVPRVDHHTPLLED